MSEITDNFFELGGDSLLITRVHSKFVESFNKDCIIVNDSPGFVSNRVLMLTVNEAIYLVHDQV